MFENSKLVERGIPPDDADVCTMRAMFQQPCRMRKKCSMNAPLRQDVTKIGHDMNMPRSKLTRIVTTATLLIWAVPIAAHPLEDAVEQAYRLCERFEVESLEACSVMGGRSPEHTAARMAMRRVYEERNAFIFQCKDGGEQCAHMAEWYIGSGLSRFNTVTFEDAPQRARR
jgi:hypothetical protein